MRPEKMIHGISLVLFLAIPAYAAESPMSILEKADRIRNPTQSFVMKVKVTSSGEDTARVFEVSTKGDNKTHVKTLAPSRDVKRDLLMVGQNMWAFIPNLNRAVRVSLSQKLSGEAANGDITRMRWSGDYEVTEESADAKSWTLLLTANKTGLTYEKVRVQVEKDTFRPIRAEYLTKAEKVLKYAVFQNYARLAGEVRPTVIEIQDAVRADKKSRIEIESMVIQNLPETLFSEARFSTR